MVSLNAIWRILLAQSVLVTAKCLNFAHRINLHLATIDHHLCLHSQWMLLAQLQILTSYVFAVLVFLLLESHRHLGIPKQALLIKGHCHPTFPEHVAAMIAVVQWNSHYRCRFFDCSGDVLKQFQVVSYSSTWFLPFSKGHLVESFTPIYTYWRNAKCSDCSVRVCMVGIQY